CEKAEKSTRRLRASADQLSRSATSTDVAGLAVCSALQGGQRDVRCRSEHQLACSVVHNAAHFVFTQPPTRTMVEITATSMTPRSTVYSTSAAPSSSRLSLFNSRNT